MSSSYHQELLLKIIFYFSVSVNMVDLGEGIKTLCDHFKCCKVSSHSVLSLSLVKSSIFLNLHNVLECTRMQVVLSQMDLCATDLLHNRLMATFYFLCIRKEYRSRCFVHPALNQENEQLSLYLHG